MTNQDDVSKAPGRMMFRSKIHRATVTQANLNYEGSLTVDALLLEAADILPYEQVHVWNVSNGNRLSTYTMVGERGTGIICVNGAGAHLVSPGDVVIIATFAVMDDAAARRHVPRIILVDGDNRVVQTITSPQRKQG